jgi:NADH-quinone oxidoreductase subunit L
LIVGPTHLFMHYLGKTPGLGQSHVGLHPTTMIISGLLSLIGIALAWFVYARPSNLAENLKRGLGPFHALSLNKFYLDEIFHSLVVFPAKALAVFCKVFDRFFVDGLVNFIATLPVRLGEVLRPIQNGMTQSYAVISLIGMGIFLLTLLRGLSP